MIITISSCSIVLEFIVPRYFHIYMYEHLEILSWLIRLLHNYVTTFDKFASVFGGWIVFCNQVFKMFSKVDIIRF